MTSFDVNAGQIKNLLFCCVEVGDGGAAMNTTSTGIVVPQDGIYEVKFTAHIEVDPVPTDWTSMDCFVNLLVYTSGNLFKFPVERGREILGRGSMEFVAITVPMRATDQVLVQVSNDSDSTAIPVRLTFDDYYLEVAYRSVFTDQFFCNEGV